MSRLLNRSVARDDGADGLKIGLRGFAPLFAGGSPPLASSCPTRFALETLALQRDYNSCWAGFEKQFKG
jgi:hypothetical protein